MKRAVVATILLLYLAVISSNWFITSDSALYLMLGESLASGDGYTLFGRPHAHVPPGYPLIIAALSSVGLGSMFGLNLFMAALGLGVIWVSYLLLREYIAPTAALLASVLLALSVEMYSHSAMQLSEIPFMFLVLTGLYGYSRGLRGARAWMEVGSVCLVACCWVRVIGAPLAAAAAIGLVLEGGRQNLRRTLLNLVAVGLGLLVTAYVFYSQYQYAKQVYNPETYAVAFDALALLPTESRMWWPLRHTYESGAHLVRLMSGQTAPHAAGWFAPGLPMIVGLWLSLRRREFTIALAVAGYFIAMLLLNPVLSRYMLPVAPVLILFYLDGASRILDCFAHLRPYRGQILAGIVTLLVLVNVPKDLRLIYRMHVAQTGYEVEWREKMLQIAEFVEQHTRDGERFTSTDSQREIAYLSGVPFVETGNPAEIDRLITKENVRFVVIGSDRRQNWRYPQLRSLVQDEQQYRMLFSNSLYQVYERTTGQRAVAQKESPTQRQ